MSLIFHSYVILVAELVSSTLVAEENGQYEGVRLVPSNTNWVGHNITSPSNTRPCHRPLVVAQPPTRLEGCPQGLIDLYNGGQFSMCL